jgi:hypothetical protein
MNAEKDIEDLMKKMYVKGYSTIGLYIYYEGNDGEILKYIKKFQVELDRHRISSQVVISTKEKIESVGFHNCFKTEDIPTNWTDFSLTKSVKCLKIKEVPDKDVSELIDFINDKVDYEDEFIEVLNLK